MNGGSGPWLSLIKKDFTDYKVVQMRKDGLWSL